MKLYTYGTLRPGVNDTVEIPGQLYDLGWFPGAKLGGEGVIICEAKEVDEKATDRYEGYNPDNPEGSLYIRRPMLDGFIYEYNHSIDQCERIQSGDWLEHTNKKRGINSGRF